MDNWQLQQLLDEIAAVGTYHHVIPETGQSMPMRCIVLPQLDWVPNILEDSLELSLPPDLKSLWDHSSGVVLFEDMIYGQWGLVVWAPDQALVRHQRFANERVGSPAELQRGDFIIGEFFGDLDLLILRCDPIADDYGSAVIAQELAPRAEWPIVAASLVEFLQRFLHSNLDRFGKKYWERYLGGN